MLRSFVRLHWQIQEPPGPSTPLPTYPAGNPRWFGHPLSGQEGQRTAVFIDHHSNAPRGAVASSRVWSRGCHHERVPSETDLLGRRLLAWSTPTPGMAVPYGNRWVSG